MSWTQVQGDPVVVRPQRSIGGIYPDVVVEEHHEDSLEITEHPVEQGAAISDHAFAHPKRVSISAAIADSDTASAREMYDKLLELQAKREPFDISTGKRLYLNMLIEHLAVTTTAASEHSFQFTAECREVILVSSRTTTLPPADRHRHPQKTAPVEQKGRVQAQPYTPKPDSSLLRKGSDAAKDLF